MRLLQKTSHRTWPKLGRVLSVVLLIVLLMAVIISAIQQSNERDAANMQEVPGTTATPLEPSAPPPTPSAPLPDQKRVKTFEMAAFISDSNVRTKRLQACSCATARYIKSAARLTGKLSTKGKVKGRKSGTKVSVQSLITANKQNPAAASVLSSLTVSTIRGGVVVDGPFPLVTHETKLIKTADGWQANREISRR